MHHEDIKILIVEDEIFAAKYLEGLLGSLGFRDVLKATNAQDALKIVREHSISLAFMDINIKGPIDGIECSHILNQEYAIPIIFTTAYGDSQTINEATDTNLCGYLLKPFDKPNLEATLKVAMKLRENEQTKQSSENKQQSEVVELAKGQRFNLFTNTLIIENKRVELTEKESTLLAFLVNNRNQNISYETLKESVWQNYDISNSTIRDTVSRLKRKVPVLHIENIKNLGYVLKA